MGYRQWSAIHRLGFWVAVGLVLLLIWPTRWIIVSTSNRVYRIDRVTGCYQYATEQAWSRPWSC